ncbi:hypothetical protein LIER_06202 [Lithospermum erythrorhizon]|uniref:Uncharacterized protein n=1 Tax=Lithospermum erythrorhizon TaxID=34254 RepID=A0AAV3P3F2_LITER
MELLSGSSQVGEDMLNYEQTEVLLQPTPFTTIEKLGSDLMDSKEVYSMSCVETFSDLKCSTDDFITYIDVKKLCKISVFGSINVSSYEFIVNEVGGIYHEFKFESLCGNNVGVAQSRLLIILAKANNTLIVDNDTTEMRKIDLRTHFGIIVRSGIRELIKVITTVAYITTPGQPVVCFDPAYMVSEGVIVNIHYKDVAKSVWKDIFATNMSVEVTSVIDFQRFWTGLHISFQQCGASSNVLAVPAITSRSLKHGSHEEFWNHTKLDELLFYHYLKSSDGMARMNKDQNVIQTYVRQVLITNYCE